MVKPALVTSTKPGTAGSEPQMLAYNPNPARPFSLTDARHAFMNCPDSEQMVPKLGAVGHLNAHGTCGRTLHLGGRLSS